MFDITDINGLSDGSMLCLYRIENSSAHKISEELQLGTSPPLILVYLMFILYRIHLHMYVYMYLKFIFLLFYILFLVISLIYFTAIIHLRRFCNTL